MLEALPAQGDDGPSQVPGSVTVADRLRAAWPRSWLFVPALRAPDWLAKAIGSGADAVIIDLEDATAPTERVRARDVVRGLAIASREWPAIFVRVNGTADHVGADVAAAVASGADGVVIPKVDVPEDLRRAASLLVDAEAIARRDQPMAIVPMIESPRAVLRALDIADADRRVAGLAFGAGDLAARAGLTRSREGSEIAVARGLIAMAAAAAGVGALDTPFLDIADLEGLRAETMEVRRLGFTGKLAIHPSHVQAINDAFTPSAEEITDAQGIIDALERALAEGSGVARYDGRMIDSPDAAQAHRVLARAYHRAR